MLRWKQALALVVAVCLTGPAVAQVRGFGLSEAGEEAAKEKANTPAAAWTVEAAIAEMSLRARVSQLLMVTLAGRLGPDASERQILENYTPGAVIISNLTVPERGGLCVALQSNPGRSTGCQC